MTSSDDDYDPLALEEQACYALVVAARRVVALYRPILEPLGLTHAQYLVMLSLWGGRSHSVKNLSDELHLDDATLSVMLKRLESMGLIFRRRNSKDVRLLEIHLTEKGIALRAEAVSVPEQVQARLRLRGSEIEQLRTSLNRVVEATQAPVER